MVFTCPKYPPPTYQPPLIAHRQPSHGCKTTATCHPVCGPESPYGVGGVGGCTGMSSTHPNHTLKFLHALRAAVSTSSTLLAAVISSREASIADSAARSRASGAPSCSTFVGTTDGDGDHSSGAPSFSTFGGACATRGCVRRGHGISLVRRGPRS